MLVAEQVEGAEGYTDVRLTQEPLKGHKDEGDERSTRREVVVGQSYVERPPGGDDDAASASREDWSSTQQASTMPRHRRAEHQHQEPRAIDRHHSTSSGSMQRVDTASAASSTTTGGGRRSRSRSSSKERLLRRLAEAEGATKTPIDEDEVEGKEIVVLLGPNPLELRAKGERGTRGSCPFSPFVRPLLRNITMFFPLRPLCGRLPQVGVGLHRQAPVGRGPAATANAAEPANIRRSGR